MGLRRIGIALGCVAAAGCGSLVGDYAVGETTSSTGGEGGAGGGTTSTTGGGGMGGATTATTGGGGIGGEGGEGGAPPLIVDRGLLARYYMDESDDGMLQAALLDAAPAPLDVPIVNQNGLEAHTTPNQAGIRYALNDVNGRAAVPLEDSKLEALASSTTVTFELVETTLDSTETDRYVFFGEGGREDLSFLRDNDTFGTTWAENTVAEAEKNWPNAPDGQRRVSHLVVDTSLPNQDRLQLYVDGVFQDVFQSSGIVPENETIRIVEEAELGIGNVQGGGRNIVGTIHYVAIYSSALDAMEIANNVAVLQASDDTPRPAGD